jgi:hypothetical protein
VHGAILHRPKTGQAPLRGPVEEIRRVCRGFVHNSGRLSDLSPCGLPRTASRCCFNLLPRRARRTCESRGWAPDMQGRRQQKARILRIFNNQHFHSRPCSLWKSRRIEGSWPRNCRDLLRTRSEMSRRVEDVTVVLAQPRRPCHSRHAPDLSEELALCGTGAERLGPGSNQVPVFDLRDVSRKEGRAARRSPRRSRRRTPQASVPLPEFSNLT